MNSLSSVTNRYIHLAKTISELWPVEFSECCANCREICCRPHMAEEVDSSTWLGAIAKIENPSWQKRPGSRHHSCAALDKTGCIFVGAKPPFCSAFYCDALLTSILDPWDLISCLFLSSILVDTCRLHRTTNLLDLNERELAENTGLIEQGIQKGEDNLRIYQWYRGQSNGEARHRGVLKMLCRMPSLLTHSVAQKISLQIGDLGES